MTVVPRECWPLWARTIAALAAPEDQGVGDTVARLIGQQNSEDLKAMVRAVTGKSCGCQARRDLWNAQYPYRKEKCNGSYHSTADAVE